MEQTKIEEKDISKLNELIFEEPKCKNITWKEAFFTKWLVGFWISIILILGICIFQWIPIQQNHILLLIEKIVLCICFMYSLLAILSNIIKNYVDITKTTIDVKASAPKLYLFENNKLMNIFAFLTDLTEKDKYFVPNYIQILLTQIKKDSKYNEFAFGGFQVLSVGMFFMSVLDLIKNFNEIIKNEQYYQLVLVVTPIIVAYWLLIGKIKKDRIKTILYYLTLFEEKNKRNNF